HPEEALRQHQFGECGAVLALRDGGELLAERRETRVAVGFRRRDGECRIGRGRRDRWLGLLRLSLLGLRRRRALLRRRRDVLAGTRQLRDGGLRERTRDQGGDNKRRVSHLGPPRAMRST